MIINPFNLQKVLSSFSDQSDFDQIINRLKQIELGITAEDEILTILIWLGQCSLCHKIENNAFFSEQFSEMIVPDLIAVFAGKSTQQKCCIEVKSTKDKNLKWSEKYYSSLCRYGEILDLPIYVAWKHVEIGVWTLTDIAMFEKNITGYKLTTEKSFQENVLGKLAGDCLFQLMEDVSFNLLLSKISVIDHEDEYNETWEMKIEKAWFADAKNNIHEKTPNSLFSLFLSSDIKEETNFANNTVSIKFKVINESADGFNLKWLHQYLIQYMKLLHNSNGGIKWLTELKHNHLPSPGNEAKEFMKNTFGTFSKYIIEQKTLSESK